MSGVGGTVRFDKSRPLLDLLLKQIADPDEGKDLTPMGWMIKGIHQWDKDRPGALADLRTYGRQGILDLYRYIIGQPQRFKVSAEGFVLGYEPGGDIPAGAAQRLDTWYRCMDAVFRWLNVPEGDDLTNVLADEFQKEVGDAIIEVADVLIPSQAAWARIQ